MELLLVIPISFEMLHFHYHFSHDIFLNSWFLLWSICFSEVWCLTSTYLWIFQLSYCYWYLVLYHCGKRNTRHIFSLFEFVKTFCELTYDLSWRMFSVDLLRCVRFRTKTYKHLRYCHLAKSKMAYFLLSWMGPEGFTVLQV